MLKGLGILVLAAAVGGGVGALTWARPSPPPQALLDDLAAVRVQVQQAEKDATNAGGLLGAQMAFRLATLRSTEAMLEQRRLAWMRGIDLRYDESRPGGVVPDAERTRIEAEIAKAEADVTQAEAEAARYSGGLILAMLNVRAATGRVTIAQLQQTLALSRNGIPAPQLVATAAKPPEAPGRSTSDADALR